MLHYVAVNVFRVQLSLVSVAAEGFSTSTEQPHDLKSGIQKMSITHIHLITICDEAGLNDWPSITRQLCGKGRHRVQFPKYLFSCLIMIPVLAFLPYFTKYTPCNVCSKQPADNSFLTVAPAYP